MIRANANTGWRMSYQVAPEMPERCAFSELNSSLFGLIWMADPRVIITAIGDIHERINKGT
jgi:hypothetical protein